MPDEPNTVEPKKPRRRWFQFRLRTLLIVVPLLGCWLAYHLNWIRERHHALESGELSEATWDGMPSQSAPLTIRFFGERGYVELFYSHRHGSPSKVVHWEKLFPEATINDDLFIH